MYRRDDLGNNGLTLAPWREFFILFYFFISTMKVRKSLKALLQSAQVTRCRSCRNSTGEPPVWDRQYLMNPAGPVTGIPGLFFSPSSPS